MPPDKMTILNSEVSRILASPLFIRSPVLAALLGFLMRAAISGGKSPNQYAVGTLALGLEDDFDPRLDSTVRVTMRRLRVALASYYGLFLPESGLCAHVKRGRYALELVRHEALYRGFEAKHSSNDGGQWDAREDIVGSGFNGPRGHMD